MKTLNACGISCPEPLIMLKNALASEQKLVLLVDSKNARDNCRDYALSRGCSVSVTASGDTYTLNISTAK